MTLRKRWFSNKVVSTEGYYVEIVDRATILYKDAKGRVYVSAEKLATKLAWALYPEDMRVGSVRGKQLGDGTRRALIVERISAVFEFLGWRLD
jgi:hypothetical protein